MSDDSDPDDVIDGVVYTINDDFLNKKERYADTATHYISELEDFLSTITSLNDDVVSKIEYFKYMINIYAKACYIAEHEQIYKKHISKAYYSLADASTTSNVKKLRRINNRFDRIIKN